MIFHIMKDGTRRTSIDGYVVKYEQKKELYKRLKKVRETKDHEHKSSTRTIDKKQIPNR